jgi:hypothetical protein
MTSKSKKNLQKEKGGGIVLLLDFLFLLIGIGILIFYLAKSEAFTGWLFKK